MGYEYIKSAYDIRLLQTLKYDAMQGNNACSLKASIFVRTFKVLHSSSCFSFVSHFEHCHLVLSLMRAMMLERFARRTMSRLTWAPAASSLARWRPPVWPGQGRAGGWPGPWPTCLASRSKSRNSTTG